MASLLPTRSFPLKGEGFRDYVECIAKHLQGADVYYPAPNLVLFQTRRQTFFLGRGRNWKAQATRLLAQVRGY